MSGKNHKFLFGSSYMLVSLLPLASFTASLPTAGFFGARQLPKIKAIITTLATRHFFPNVMPTFNHTALQIASKNFIITDEN